jgi:hypothetical protein
MTNTKMPATSNDQNNAPNSQQPQENQVKTTPRPGERPKPGRKPLFRS